jgi:phosphoglycolate phosphatase
MFDFDGTLIDSRKDLCTAVNLMRGGYGLPPLPVETVAGYVGDGIGALVERSLQGHPADLAEATRACAAHYAAHLHDETALYPGVEDGLRRLHGAGHRLAVVTNKPAQHTRTILDHFAIDGLFTRILGGGDTSKLKPDPEPLLRVMSELEAKPADSWMIGDHKTDLEAARRAGIRSIWIGHGFGEMGPETPTRRFDTFAEMTDFLLK